MKKWSFVFKLNDEFAIGLRIVTRHARKERFGSHLHSLGTSVQKKRGFLVLCTLFDDRPKFYKYSQPSVQAKKEEIGR